MSERLLFSQSHDHNLLFLLTPEKHSSSQPAGFVLNPFVIYIIWFALCRISSLNVFHPDAIELCARKVASVSGDVRRALHQIEWCWNSPVIARVQVLFFLPSHTLPVFFLSQQRVMVSL